MHFVNVADKKQQGTTQFPYMELKKAFNRWFRTNSELKDLGLYLKGDLLTKTSCRWP